MADIFDDLLLAFRLLNLLVALYLTLRMVFLMREKREASMANTFRILALGFLLLFTVIGIRIISFLPAYRWDVIEAFAQLVFMLTIFYAVNKLHTTITAYEYLSQRKGKTRDLE